MRIQELDSGGMGYPLSGKTDSKNQLDHWRTAEYVPELLPEGVRQDLKELNVIQPDGPSFKVSDESLVEWQKWRFRVTFTPREGAVIHDVHYDGRSVFYRLSMSEMVRLLVAVNPSWRNILTLFLMDRQYPMQILELLSTENRHSTSARAVLVCAQII
jgi:hypothetical protein